MQLSTHFGNLDASVTARQNVNEAIMSSIERFQSRVRKVQISFRDTNGPKGGPDKLCRCVIHLKRMAPVVIEDSGSSVRALVQSVCERVAFIMSQKVGKSQTKNRRRGNRRPNALRNPDEAAAQRDSGQAA